LVRLERPASGRVNDDALRPSTRPRRGQEAAVIDTTLTPAQTRHQGLRARPVFSVRGSHPHRRPHALPLSPSGREIAPATQDQQTAQVSPTARRARRCRPGELLRPSLTARDPGWPGQARPGRKKGQGKRNMRARALKPRLQQRRRSRLDPLLQQRHERRPLQPRRDRLQVFSYTTHTRLPEEPFAGQWTPEFVATGCRANLGPDKAGDAGLVSGAAPGPGDGPRGRITSCRPSSSPVRASTIICEGVAWPPRSMTITREVEYQPMNGTHTAPSSSPGRGGQVGEGRSVEHALVLPAIRAARWAWCSRRGFPPHAADRSQPGQGGAIFRATSDPASVATRTAPVGTAASTQAVDTTIEAVKISGTDEDQARRPPGPGRVRLAARWARPRAHDHSI